MSEAIRYEDAVTVTSANEEILTESRVTSGVQWEKDLPIHGLVDWQVEVAKRIFELENLPTNWDGFDSAPPSPRTVETALRVLLRSPSVDLPLPHVVPISGGGLQVEWTTEGRGLQIDFSPDSAVSYLKTRAGAPLEEGGIEQHQVASLLAWLGL